MFRRDVRGPRASDGPCAIACISLDLCQSCGGGGGGGEKRKKKKRKKKKEGEKGKMQNKSEREEKNRRHERGREKSSKAESWVGDGGCESECRAGAFKKTEYTGSVER